jgi:hypothetical protein
LYRYLGSPPRVLSSQPQLLFLRPSNSSSGSDLRQTPGLDYISLRGLGFAHSGRPHFCRFNSTQPTGLPLPSLDQELPATVVTDHEITCPLPLVSVQDWQAVATIPQFKFHLSVSVSSDRVLYSDPVLLLTAGRLPTIMHVQPQILSLDPSDARAATQAIDLTLSGQDFVTSSSLACVFGRLPQHQQPASDDRDASWNYLLSLPAAGTQSTGNQLRQELDQSAFFASV